MAVENILPWTLEYRHLNWLNFLWIYPEVRLLDHIEVVFLIFFRKPHQCFPQWLHQLALLLTMYNYYIINISLPTLVISCLFDDSHSEMCQVISYCGFFFFKFFWSHLWQVEVPGPGIKPVPQQWPKSLEWQCWILNPLSFKRTPLIVVSICISLVISDVVHLCTYLLAKK